MAEGMLRCSGKGGRMGMRKGGGCTACAGAVAASFCGTQR